MMPRQAAVMDHADKLQGERHPLESDPYHPLYFFMTPFLWRHRTKETLVSDLERDTWKLPSFLTASSILESGQIERAEENLTMRASNDGDKCKPFLLRWLVRNYWRRWLLAGFYYAGWCTMAAPQPFIVAELVKCISDPKGDFSDGAVWCCVLFATTLIFIGSINWKFHHLTINAMQLRSALVILLHRKALRLHCSPSTTDGLSMLNLMSNDTEHIFEASIWLHYLWIGVIYIFVVLAAVTVKLGISALVGFAILFISLPSNMLFGKLIARQKAKMVVHSDVRTTFIGQILNGIEVVKVFAWENAFMERIRKTRSAEISWLLKFLTSKQATRSIQFIMPSIVVFSTVATFAALNGTSELTLDIVFLVISFVGILRFPLLLIPHAISTSAEALISINRLEAFLTLEEFDEGVNDAAAAADDDDDESGGLPLASSKAAAVSFENASFEWRAGSFRLCDINLSLCASEQNIYIVQGPVGGGKSMLLNALLGELSPIQGSVTLHKCDRRVVPYAPQAPVILPASLKENILFGMSQCSGNHELECYKKAVWAAALQKDLEHLPNGAETEIGENGVNISGGQKARIGEFVFLF